MNTGRRIAWAMMLWLGCLGSLRGAEQWVDELARMPLVHPVQELNRSNCVQTVLESICSNGVVKAVIFMPGATDELYFFRRAKAQLSGSAPTVLDAVQALTNQTLIRATFKAPFLLFHVAGDALEANISVKNQTRWEKLCKIPFQEHAYFDDRDWDWVQPLLRDRIGVELRPWRYTRASWHFYRHSYAGWNLNCREAIQATCLSGGTRATINRGSVLFEGPPRGSQAEGK